MTIPVAHCLCGISRTVRSAGHETKTAFVATGHKLSWKQKGIFLSRMQIHFMEGWKWVGSLYNSCHFLLAMTYIFRRSFPFKTRPKFQLKQGAPVKGSR